MVPVEAATIMAVLEAVKVALAVDMEVWRKPRRPAKEMTSVLAEDLGIVT